MRHSDEQDALNEQNSLDDLYAAVERLKGHGYELAYIQHEAERAYRLLAEEENNINMPFSGSIERKK